MQDLEIQFMYDNIKFDSFETIVRIWKTEGYTLEEIYKEQMLSRRPITDDMDEFDRLSYSAINNQRSQIRAIYNKVERYDLLDIAAIADDEQRKVIQKAYDKGADKGVNTKYLGETLLKKKEYPHWLKTKEQQMMYFIQRFGQIDGSHHKTWVLDQVARISKGTKIEVKLAKWSDGQKQYRVNTLEPSEAYKRWVLEMEGRLNEDEEREYDYDCGIAP